MQLVGDPSRLAVSEEQDHAGIGLEDAVVLGTDLEDELQVGFVGRELVPVAEVGFHDSVVAQRQPAFAGDVVRQVGTDEVDGTVGDLGQGIQTIGMDDPVFRSALARLGRCRRLDWIGGSVAQSHGLSGCGL